MQIFFSQVAPSHVQIDLNAIAFMHVFKKKKKKKKNIRTWNIFRLSGNKLQFHLDDVVWSFWVQLHLIIQSHSFLSFGIVSIIFFRFSDRKSDFPFVLKKNAQKREQPEIVIHIKMLLLQRWPLYKILQLTPLKTAKKEFI